MPKTAIGKRLLLIQRTTIWDRAGETGTSLAKLGEIVAVDPAGWIVAWTKRGELLQCPIRKTFSSMGMAFIVEHRPQPHADFVAAAELIRDIHSITRPIRFHWLTKRQIQQYYGKSFEVSR